MASSSSAEVSRSGHTTCRRGPGACSRQMHTLPAHPLSPSTWASQGAPAFTWEAACKGNLGLAFLLPVGPIEVTLPVTEVLTAQFKHLYSFKQQTASSFPKGNGEMWASCWGCSSVLLLSSRFRDLSSPFSGSWASAQLLLPWTQGTTECR